MKGEIIWIWKISGVKNTFFLFGVDDFRQLPLKDIQERIDDGDETTPL